MDFLPLYRSYQLHFFPIRKQVLPMRSAYILSEWVQIPRLSRLDYWKSASLITMTRINICWYEQYHWHGSIFTEYETIRSKKENNLWHRQMQFYYVFKSFLEEVFYMHYNSYIIVRWEVRCIVKDVARRHSHFSTGLKRWFVIIVIESVGRIKKIYFWLNESDTIINYIRYW